MKKMHIFEVVMHIKIEWHVAGSEVHIVEVGRRLGRTGSLVNKCSLIR
jgi:hypothetical protein